VTTITFKDRAEFYTDDDRAIFENDSKLETVKKSLYAESAAVKAAIENNENPDPNPAARIETLIATGTNTPPPKTFAERDIELQYSIRDVEEALDFMAGKKKLANYGAGKRLADWLKPQADAAEKDLVEKGVAFHEAHLKILVREAAPY
jgi:hypothetical protein